MRGETTITEFIFAGNFTVENASQGCAGTAMSNATSKNITSSMLRKGNHSLKYNNATSGQEELYFCLKEIPSTSSPQSYSSSFYGSWEIRIVLVALASGEAFRRRKKKKSPKDDRLLEVMDSILDELKEKYSLNNKETTEVIVSRLKEKHKINKKEILEIIRNLEEIKIPISIFNKNLGALESLTKYMKENLNMTYKEISQELVRDERTIWTAYKKAYEKQTAPLEIKDDEINIPIDIFKDEELTVLEAVILYLKRKGMKYVEIGKLLDRDQRNIRTIHLNAVEKIKRNL